MKSLGQLLLGLITAVVSITLIVSAFSLSLIEGRSTAVAVVTGEPTNALSSTPEPLTGITRAANPTTPGGTPPQTSTATPTEIQPTACPAPSGWKPYEVQPGDTLEYLAAQTGTTSASIRSANCLTVSSLMPGTILYLPLKSTPTINAPSTPTPLPTVVATILSSTCSPPTSWARYVVRSGDTLFRLGLSVGLTTDALRSINCLTSDRIYVGQILYLPFIPARTATPVPTNTATDRPIPTVIVRTQTRQPTATATPKPVIPTMTPITPTATPVTPTVTPIPPTATLTPAPNTATPTPTTPVPPTLEALATPDSGAGTPVTP
jgi:LysM repeat protein